MNSGKQSKVYSNGMNAESRKRQLKTGRKALRQFYSLLLHPLPSRTARSLQEGSLYFQRGALVPDSRGSRVDLTWKLLRLSVQTGLRATWGADYTALTFVLPNSESTQGWKIPALLKNTVRQWKAHSQLEKREWLRRTIDFLKQRGKAKEKLGKTRAFKCALGYWGIEKVMHMPRAGYMLGKVTGWSVAFSTG